MFCECLVRLNGSHIIQIKDKIFFYSLKLKSERHTIVERNHAITVMFQYTDLLLSIRFNVYERYIHFVMYNNIKHTFS